VNIPVAYQNLKLAHKNMNEIINSTEKEGSSISVTRL
jgi:hypothetical protein